MENSFIRGIWGIYDINKTLSKWYSRRSKIDNDITLAKINPYCPKCKVYIFGEENFKIMTDKGFDTVLIDKKPFVWDMEKEQYRHKIEIWKAGLSEFKRIVFLDWDCIPVRKIPDDFWSIISEGENIKATLYKYVNRRLLYRRRDRNIVAASTFVYINGIEVANSIIETWEKLGRPWQEEVALTKYIDDINGGWNGPLSHMNKFEPKFHTLFYDYPSDFIKDIMLKYNMFYHLNCNRVNIFLGNGEENGIIKRLDRWNDREVNSIKTLYERRVKEEQNARK